MKALLGKLGFIHRRLWEREGSYRVAVLLGPSPLIGGVLAIVLWQGVAMSQRMLYRPPAWATPQAPASWNTGEGAAQIVAPARPLPAADPDGKLVGYQSGWGVTTHAMAIGPTLDIQIKRPVIAVVPMEGVSVDMSQIAPWGPGDALFVGIGTGYLAVRDGGVYALSARLMRPAGSVADCFVALNFSGRRILSNQELNIARAFAKDFDSAQFELQPGLYATSWAFGCWHERAVLSEGSMTLLVRHPGEPKALPARADDIVRPEPGRSPSPP